MIDSYNTLSSEGGIVNFEEKMSPVLNAMRKVNNFLIQGLTSVLGECRPLIVSGKQVGLVRSDIGSCLLEYPHVFTAFPSAFVLNPQLDTYKARSDAIAMVLEDLRKKTNLASLKTWRNECFNVYSNFGSDPLFQIERAAVTAFGIRSFGVSVTGYFRDANGSIFVWLQKRAIDKKTYPGMMDTMVGGGITAGLTPSDVLVKEAMEEASIPSHIISNAVSAGCVSIFFESKRGVHANTEFVYDLELPIDFIPHNSDGEVESFEAIPIQNLLPIILSSKYKTTSIPIAVDFLIRHGMLQDDNIPAIQELLHVPLHFFYSSGIAMGYSTMHNSSIERPLTPNSSTCSSTENQQDCDDMSETNDTNPFKKNV